MSTKIHIDSDLDTIAIAGVRYALGLFRTLGIAPIGSTFKIVQRGPDGLLMLQRIEPSYSTLVVPPAQTWMGRTALADVALERMRQIEAEGYVPAHDDRYQGDELAIAGACYAMPPEQQPTLTRTESDGQAYVIPRLWPWHARWWKPTTRRRNLVKACALLVAEIERIDRQARK